MRTVHFFIDNLAIGGFQRLCLDQAYLFASDGHKVEIHVLNDMQNSNSNSFVNLEANFISELDVSVSPMSSSHRSQIKLTCEILRNLEKTDLLISHSLRATVVLWVSKRILRRNSFFITTIHQLPSLSAPVQRTRRFLYAQLSSILVAYSSAVKSDWEMRVSRSVFSRTFVNKEISLLRNGIYLNRLPANLLNSEKVKAKRLVYLGRNTGWKGIETLLRYANLESLRDFDILLMLPEIDAKWEKELRNEFGKRIEISVGKTLSGYQPQIGDVHFYAAQYGPKAKFVESISLNCLEMAALGIPSVVTSGGLGTWPDLAEIRIFTECDWGDVDGTSEVIRQLSDRIFSPSVIAEIRELINIRHNVEKIDQALSELVQNC
jgi:glycosyltransferase involved in cell wall biosynthesis